MESFGIPDPAATTSALAGLVAANNSALQGVAMDAIAPLGTTLSQNDALLGKVGSTINRSLAGRVTANSNQINTVGNALAGNLAGTVGANQAQLNSASVPPMTFSHGTQCRVWVRDSTREASFACSDLDLTKYGFRTQADWWYPGPAEASTAIQAIGYRFISLPEAAKPIAGTFPAPTPPKPTGTIPAPSPTVPGSTPVSVPTMPGTLPPPAMSTALPIGVELDSSGSCFIDPQTLPLGPPDTWGQPWLHTWVNTTTHSVGIFNWGFVPDGAGWHRTWLTASQRPVRHTDHLQGSTVPYSVDVWTQHGYNWVGQGPPATACPIPTTTPNLPALPPETPVPGYVPINQPPAASPDSSPDAPIGCIFPDARGQGKVGSAEWCANADKLLTQVQALGDAIKGYFGSLIAGTEPDKKSWTSWLSSTAFPALSLGPGIAERLIDYFDDKLLVKLKGIWTCLTATVNSLSTCNTSATVSIALVRAILGALHNVRAGWDAAIWITLDFAVTLPELEAYLAYLGNMACPVTVPELPDAIECWMRGTISEPQFRCWMLMRGADPEVWIPVLNARREQLAPEEAIQLARRRDVDIAKQGDVLRQLGWLNPQERADRIELFDELPSIADHLHWLQRNVFDKDYVKDYSLEDGFAERFWPEFGHDLRAQGMLEKYAKLHYAAHWLLPAPGQMQEMVYRLRPGKEGVQNPFSVGDYQRLLAEQDVAPYFRPRFAEIIYKVPALSYAREQYFQFLWTDDELKSYHQDLGYSDKDSEKFLAIDKIVRARRRASSGHAWTPAAISKAYAAGLVKDTDVTKEMDRQGYTADEATLLMKRAKSDMDYLVFSRAKSRLMSGTVQHVRNALRVGVLDKAGASHALVNLGWDQTRADAIADLEQTMADTDRTKKVVQRLRSAFHAGEIDATYAQQALQQLGIVPGAIQSYLTAWAIEQTPNRKRRTAAQITADVASGLLTTADALARLANLGYGQPDQMLYLADAQAAVRKTQAKNLAQQQRQAKQSAAAVQKLINDTTRLQKGLRNRLNRLAPPSKLKKWAVQGTMNEATYRARLAALGFDPVDIDRYWQEVTKDAKYTPAQGNAIGTGEPGVSGGPIPPI